MEVTAQLANARMTPRKARGLREVIVGLPVREARAQLVFQNNKAAVIIGKVLGSAVANAQHNYKIEEGNLVVAELKVDEGTRLKRWRPVSHGTAHAFVKRASHLTVVLEELQATKRKVKKAAKKKADIDTFTVEDLARRERMDKAHVDESVAAKTPRLSKTARAFQKMKMRQQGGDKKKTYRRKSI